MISISEQTDMFIYSFTKFQNLSPNNGLLQVKIASVYLRLVFFQSINLKSREMLANQRSYLTIPRTNLSSTTFLIKFYRGRGGSKLCYLRNKTQSKFQVFTTNTICHSVTRTQPHSVRTLKLRSFRSVELLLLLSLH